MVSLSIIEISLLPWSIYQTDSQLDLLNFCFHHFPMNLTVFAEAKCLYWILKDQASEFSGLHGADFSQNAIPKGR